MSNKLAHLEMLQAIIARLENNSFLLKSWSVVLVSAIFALAAKDADRQFVLLAYLPALCFWGLDGYFLRRERLFRYLYDHVRLKGDSEIDFCMDVSAVESAVDPWWRVSLSTTLLPFHGAILATVATVTIVTFS